MDLRETWDLVLEEFQARRGRCRPRLTCPWSSTEGSPLPVGWCCDKGGKVKGHTNGHEVGCFRRRVQHLIQLNAVRHQCARPPAYEERGTNRRAWPLAGEFAPCAIGELVRCMFVCMCACVTNTLAMMYVIRSERRRRLE